MKPKLFESDVIFIKQMGTINRSIPSWKYESQHIEHWQTPENDLWQTREELEQAMPDNINWTLWDQLVDKTKREIQEMLKQEQQKQKAEKADKPTAKHVWAYQTNGKYIGEFNSVVDAGASLDISPNTVYQSLWSGKPYYSKQLYFSYHQLDEKELETLKRMKAGKYASNGYGKGGSPKGVEKWVYNLKGELLGHYSSSDEVAKAYNIERGAVNYYSYKQQPYYKKEILILSKPIENK